MKLGLFVSLSLVLFASLSSAKPKKIEKRNPSSAVNESIICESKQYSFEAAYVGSPTDDFNLEKASLKSNGKEIAANFLSNGFIGTTVTDDKGDITHYGSAYAPSIYVATDFGIFYRVDTDLNTLTIEKPFGAKAEKFKMKCKVRQ